MRRFVLEAMNSKRHSLSRLFARHDKDGSGSLDGEEFAAAMLQMGLKLEPFQVEQILAEIDIDASSQIEANEL